MGATAEEVAQLQTQVHRLREQLHEEQLLRRQAEEAVEAVATDRIRLQVRRCQGQFRLAPPAPAAAGVPTLKQASVGLAALKVLGSISHY